MRSPYLELVAGYFAVICIVFEILTAVIFTILRLELMFAARCYCKAQHTLTIWPKVIWEQAASPLLVADPLITAVHNRSTVFVWWPQCARSSNIRFLGPTYRPKRHIDRFSHFCTTDAAFSLYVVFCWQITSPPPQKKTNPLLPGWSGPPSKNTWFLGPCTQPTTWPRSTQPFLRNWYVRYQRTVRLTNRLAR